MKEHKLVRRFTTTIVDMQAYYFCAAERAARRPMVKACRAWLPDLAPRLIVRGTL